MPAQATSPHALSSVLETKGVKFHIRTGNGKWACTLQDRAAYERVKALRTSSSDSVSTTSSTATTESK